MNKLAFTAAPFHVCSGSEDYEVEMLTVGSSTTLEYNIGDWSARAHNVGKIGHVVTFHLLKVEYFLLKFEISSVAQSVPIRSV